MIELKVEDYCHDCPDFEPDCCKVFANGKIERIMVHCSYANRCRRITERLEKVVEGKYAEKAVNDDRVAPVKTMELCNRCMYNSFTGDLCRGKDCETCKLDRAGPNGCYCLQLRDGQPCLHFKKQEESND